MSDFIIIIDTREQLPYSFGDDTVTVSQALTAGDYSVVGFETRVAVERKTVDDFVGSITHQRDRFKAELVKLAKYDHACIVVEATLRDVLAKQYRSKTDPSSVLGTAVSWEQKYGVAIHWCSDRQAAQIFTKRYLKLYYEYQVKDT